ncbi:hypothetical protein D0Y65_008904 [Glycine soja]|uniref:Uncharacterized protein n=1 Tax=Glycine soja TaxID=3848 RepID=A0A445KWQ6_GLYSO|nr:hypothetical protein D0Y65_008904 [Glycine soja]
MLFIKLATIAECDSSNVLGMLNIFLIKEEKYIGEINERVDLLRMDIVYLSLVKVLKVPYLLYSL